MNVSKRAPAQVARFDVFVIPDGAVEARPVDGPWPKHCRPAAGGYFPSGDFTSFSIASEAFTMPSDTYRS